MRQYKIIMKEHIDYPIYIVHQNNHEISFENDFSKSIKDQLTKKYQNINNFFKETLKSEEISHHSSIIGEVIEVGELFFKPVYKTMKWLDNKIAVILILVNITSEKLIAKVNEEASKFKDLLLASVSHDLRTPINCILNMIDLSLMKIVDPDLRSMLLNARESCELLLAIVNDLLDFSQIKANKLTIRKEIFMLSEVTDRIYHLFANSMKEKKLDFRISFSDSCLKLQSDKFRLERVLINLISNSQKFTRQGSIDLNIVENIENNKVLFKVIDTGIGIKDEDKGKLFQLFSSLDEKGINTHGVGLGLTISNIIVQKLNKGISGITCQSEYGVGSTFLFELLDAMPKYEELNSNFNLSLQNVSPSSNKRGFESHFNIFETNQLLSEPNLLNSKRLNILILEDEQTNITAMKAILNVIGLTADYAYNGLEALNLIERKKEMGYYFDLIISDINMPIMNGYQFIKNFKEKDPKYLENCHVIACTANASNSSKLYLEYGFDSYIEKPINLKAIRKIIQSLQ